ncbi:MAG: tRNA lysidine(34) synthetase TilS [Actinomycetota bacterium]|nr:tRNA lysidine(34) synthetase TilS [Actinomycetota bacterium]
MVETRRLTQLTSKLGDLLETPDGDLVVALSGGADSAALAYLLSAADRPYRAVHINHGLPDSPSLEKAAREVADKLGVDLDVVMIEVPAGASAEGQARTARYAALLDRLAQREWLLIAHTLDDQAETVLMNLLRGTGPTGLAGIFPSWGRLARPLLGASRSETRELAGLAGLPYLDDPTNLDPANRRNVIRLEVLPALSTRFNPRLIEALARSATLIRSDDSHLESEAESVSIVTRDSSVAIAVGGLLAVPRPVADRVLRRGLAMVRPPHSGSAAELDQIWAVALGGQRLASLTGGVEVSVEGPLLVFGVQDRGNVLSEPTELDVGTHYVGRFEVIVERVDGVCGAAPIGSWSAIFDPEEQLTGQVDERGRLVVEAGGQLAWLVGERRLDVAWYRPGTSGYLSVFAREESGWTSSP